MSKSIHDYKEAMDNIKISESFYKRTEVLLTEMPEVKIEKRPVISGRRVSAVIMSAAACVICLFGVKLAIDGRQADIVTETVSDGYITETGKAADELIDELSEYEEDMIADDFEEDVLDDEEQATPDSVEPIAANPATSPESYAVSTEAPAKTTSEEKTTAAATTSQATVTTEKRVVQGIDPNTPSEPNDMDGGDEPTVAMPNPAASSGVGSDSEEVDTEDDAPADEDTDNDEAAPVENESTQLFSELSINNTTVDITPYFNMGDIKSGEGTLKKSGTEFKPVLDLIAGMESSATKIGNSSFTSLFSIRIYDENIDLEFYSIYLTNHESIVITRHSPDGSQTRETYALRREYYESIRYQLFLLFGSESDYELFTNLIGGK
ncbi:MAG: hypothetical protein K2H90_01155 [Oscillospiraceae bacterium]|nr:hypothetical protein [Oscillospiraceae bacterium]